jgi:sugar transferase (PEP-CTERM/EpsH1 system associated)
MLAAACELEIVSLVHDRAELAQVTEMRAQGLAVSGFLTPRVRNYARAVAALPGEQPLTHVLLDAPGLLGTLEEISRTRRPDVVLAYCSGMARFAVEPPLSDIPMVLDMVEVDSAKWAALAHGAGPIRSWVYRREADRLEGFERRAATLAVQTTVVNEREGELLRRIAAGAAIQVVPNGVDLDALQPTSAPSEHPVVVFCGVMDYPPNVQGVQWFVEEVWPILIERRPDTQFTIVGSNPVPAIRELPARDRRIHVTGSVPDVRPFLWNAAVSIAPIKTARGVQNKVLEAVAAGLPAVATAAVYEGLPSEVRPACSVADDAAGFAERTESLLARTGGERRGIARRADLTTLTWAKRLDPLRRALSAAASR